MAFPYRLRHSGEPSSEMIGAIDYITFRGGGGVSQKVMPISKYHVIMKVIGGGGQSYLTTKNHMNELPLMNVRVLSNIDLFKEKKMTKF